MNKVKKELQIIEAIKTMSEKETVILEAFIAGLKAGRQSAGRESESGQIYQAGRSGK